MIKLLLRKLLFIFCLLLLNGVAFAAPVSDLNKQSIPNSSAKSNTTNSKTTNKAVKKTKRYVPPAAPTSLWQYIREYFTLDHEIDNPRVKYYIYYYQTHTSTLEVVLSQARYYLYPVVQAVRQRNMPMELALLPIIESGFRPYITSEAGAAGIWQLMPDTAERFKIDVNNHWFDGRADTNESTDAALSYLQYLYGLFNNDWLLAVAAYNSGEGNVQKAINTNAANGHPTDFWSLQLPLQTQDYVPKLLAVSAIVASPERYGIYLPSVPNKPLTGKVLLQKQLSLDTAAKLAGINRDIFNKLNPGFLQSATPPKGGYYLILPISRLALFEANLQNYLNPQAARKRYQVQAGDTIETIASKTKTPVATLQKLNKLTSKTSLQTGQYLIYPAPRKSKTYTIKSGDTLNSVASRFNITPSQLATWNQLPNNASLNPGKVLIISS